MDASNSTLGRHPRRPAPSPQGHTPRAPAPPDGSAATETSRSGRHPDATPGETPTGRATRMEGITLTQLRRALKMILGSHIPRRDARRATSGQAAPKMPPGIAAA